MRTVPTTPSASPNTQLNATMTIAVPSISSRSSSAKIPCSAQNTSRRSRKLPACSQFDVATRTRNSPGTNGGAGSSHSDTLTTSYCDSDEQAPHLPQPARLSDARSDASRSIRPSGTSTARMNSDVGAACPASGVPEIGTNGTTKGVYAEPDKRFHTRTEFAPACRRGRPAGKCSPARVRTPPRLARRLRGSAEPISSPYPA